MAGVQAMGGFHSCIHVKTEEKDSIMFDAGVLLYESVSAKWVFISHGHIDHIGAAVQHARARALSHAPATYYVPEEVVEPLMRAHEAFEKLDGRKIAFQVRVMHPFDSVLIGKKNQFRVQAFPTEHRVQSQGYAVFSTTVVSPKQLLQEYQHCSGPQLAELKSRGVRVQQPAVTQEVCGSVCSSASA